MERAMVAVVGALLLLAGFAAPGECMNCYPGPAQCAPPRHAGNKNGSLRENGNGRRSPSPVRVRSQSRKSATGCKTSC